MTSILKLLVATSTISVAALGANPAFAADLGTDAGTSITNNVSVAYNVGGGPPRQRKPTAIYLSLTAK